jgi:hypothetical protein
MSGSGKRRLGKARSSKARLNMQLSRDIPALKRWRWWLAAAAIAEVGWFALLRPRHSASFHTLFLLGLLPLTVVGYVYLMVAFSSYLEKSDWDYRLRQVLVLILGSSCAFFVVSLMWFTSERFGADLS